MCIFSFLSYGETKILMPPHSHQTPVSNELRSGRSLEWRNEHIKTHKNCCCQLFLMHAHSRETLMIPEIIHLWQNVLGMAGIMWLKQLGRSTLDTAQEAEIFWSLCMESCTLISQPKNPCLDAPCQCTFWKLFLDTAVFHIILRCWSKNFPPPQNDAAKQTRPMLLSLLVLFCELSCGCWKV